MPKKSADKDIGTRWWTSGMNQGCPEKLAWCSSGNWYSQPELGVLAGINDSKKCIVLVKSSSERRLLL